MITRSIGFALLVFFLAGCQAIPQEVKEVAEVVAVAAKDVAIETAAAELKTLKDEAADNNVEDNLRRAGGASVLALSLAALVALLRKKERIN